MKQFLKKARKHNPQLYVILKFIVKLNVFAIPLYVLLFFQIKWYALQQFIADLVHGMLLSNGISAIKDALAITIPVEGGSWSAFIAWDCTGWKSILFFLALIFATDFSRQKKLRGLVFVPMIFMINIVRIWFMFFYVSIYGLTHYPIVHTLIWSWGMIAVVLIIWAVWIKFFKN